MMVNASAKSSSYDADTVDNAFDKLQPYVKVDSMKKASIDTTTAKKNGIDDKSIQIVQEYIDMQNKFIQDILDNPDKQATIDEERKEKFKDFFNKVKYVGLQNRDAHHTHYLDFILPQAFATHLCNYGGPHPQPGLSFTGNYSDRAAAVNALGSGYSQVPDHASHHEPDDFHDLVSAYFCANGVFRYQTIVFENNAGIWQHSNHHSPGEPNPDILNYNWPVWWWGIYATAWHVL